MRTSVEEIQLQRDVEVRDLISSEVSGVCCQYVANFDCMLAERPHLAECSAQEHNDAPFLYLLHK